MTAMAVHLSNPLPDAGETREVAPGVVWVRMPMPFALNHANLWAIRDPGPANSWSLVDAGLKTLDTVNAWRRILTGSGPLGGATISRVIVTHVHADHLGLAGWITRKFGCRLWMPEREYLQGCALQAQAGRMAPDDNIRFYRAAGWTDGDLETYRAQFGMYGEMIYQIPHSYRRLRDGEWIEIGGHTWQIVTGRGHSPEHACLYCPDLKLFLSGDQVLPRISTNVSVLPTEPEADPLGDWLDSIDKIRRTVPDDVLVLPGHNEPFTGLHARLDRLASGHARGLDRLYDLLRQPRRAVDTFGALFARDVMAEPELLGLATGESLAHINYLLMRKDAVVDHIADGSVWYMRASSQDRTGTAA